MSTSLQHLDGQPPCMTGCFGRRGRRACVRARWLHRAAGGLAGAARLLPRLACWRGRDSWHGRTRPRAGAGEGGRGGTALLCLSWNADCSGKRQRRWLYRALPRHGSGRGTAAPRSVARQSLATSAVSGDGRRHVRPLPRRHAWRGAGIWPRHGNRRGQKC